MRWFLRWNAASTLTSMDGRGPKSRAESDGRVECESDGLLGFSHKSLKRLVGRLGIEPRTIRLKVECSTPELPAPERDQGKLQTFPVRSRDKTPGGVTPPECGGT